MTIRNVHAILVHVNLVFVEQKQHLQKAIAGVDVENNTFSIQIVKSVAAFSDRLFFVFKRNSFLSDEFLIFDQK